MSLSRRFTRTFVVAFSWSLACSLLAPTFGQETDQEPVVVVTDGGNPTNFDVPNGSPTDLIAFIEQLANPQQKFADDDALKSYLDPVSKAISEAADKILADKSAADQQIVDAIEWKLEALRIRYSLGETEADKQSDEFLASLAFDDRRVVATALDEIRAAREQDKAQMEMARMQVELVSKLRQWEQGDDAQRNATVDWLVAWVKDGPPTPAKARLLMEFSEFASDPPYNTFAVRAIDESLPALRASDNPGLAELADRLAGVARRLNLPGNELELAGTFLDGKQLDWNSLRGKVVLVDFWATWCGPCRAEVPNILANYEKYHDQGFEVIGVSLDDTRADAEAYVAQNNIPWPTLFDQMSPGDGWSNPMALKYGIMGIPTVILVDQQGKVVSLNARGPRLGAALAELFNSPEEKDASTVEVSDQAERTARGTTR